jgi:hypothetical protein
LISPLERLPAAARSKLEELTMARDAALDGAHSTQSRINMLPANSGLLERLTRERHRFAEKHRTFSRIVSACNQFCMENRFVCFETAAPVAVELKNGEKLTDAVSRVRAEIAGLGVQLAKVKTAPLPVADRADLVNQYVGELMQRGPAIAIVQDKLKLNFHGDCFAPEDVLALIAWAFPGALADRIERKIGDLPLPPQAESMSKDDRLKKTAELEFQLLQTEHREESLIERAAADGLEILRRPDASPLAVLGVQVQIVAAQARQVA